MMPMDSFTKIIDEIADPFFSKRHAIIKIIIGEDGDALLHKDSISMLRYIKEKLPTIPVTLYSNIQNLTPDKSELLIKEKLINTLRCNIDGASAENYSAVKKLSFAVFEKNFHAFLALRKEFAARISIQVSVLTLNNYINIIHNNLGFYPDKMKNKGLLQIEDDFSAIARTYRKLLTPQTDKIYKTYTVVGWAERQKIKQDTIKYSQFACTHLVRIKHEAFIASDGSWYACCLDADKQLVLGNIKTQTLEEIYIGEKRNNLIAMLERKEFKKIGGPCATVNCCQPMHKNKIFSALFRKLLHNRFFVTYYYHAHFLNSKKTQKKK